MPSGGTAVKRYEEPRAHALRERYLATFGGDEIPVPVEAIAEDLLGLRVEQSSEIPYSGMLLPAERKIVLNAAEAPRDEANVFAAELLMPEPAVRAAWDELGDVGACAARFDVSPTAMHWRLYSAALIKEKFA